MSTPPDFSKFTDRARDGIKRAVKVTERMRHSFVGTEHILVGILGTGATGVAVTALRNLNVAPEVVEREVEKLGSEKTTYPGPTPFTARSLYAIMRADELRCEFGHHAVGTEHVLLGLLESGTEASQVLINCGTTVEAVRREVLGLLGVPCAVHDARKALLIREIAQWLVNFGRSTSLVEHESRTTILKHTSVPSEHVSVDEAVAALTKDLA